MKPSHFLYIAISVVFLFAVLGVSQPVIADAGTTATPDSVVVIVRQLTYWQGSFIGFVDAQTYEKWPFTLDQSQQFVVTAVPATSDFTALVLLLDANGNELARGTGTLTATEPAGNYAVLVQPMTGSGFYQLNLRQVSQPTPTEPTPTEPPPTQPAGPSVTTVVDPLNISVGGSAVATVSLNDVPADGYTSAEFTCTYDAGLVDASNIAAAGLFGSDAAVALNGPQNGSFILAIAGSNGNKATAGGTALTFSLTGLLSGQTAVECKARVSTGDGTLSEIPSNAGGVTVEGNVTPTEPPPTETSTPTAEPTMEAPTATPTAVSSGALTGQVNAGKPVTVSLFNADSSLATSVSANSDGTFSLTAPAGTYTAVASASGFLKAQGSVTLTDGGTATLPTISLVPGDLDGNNVIDQFDAMTIGMNYNSSSPAAADLNNDGVINVLDLQLLAQHYRASGALAWQ